MCAMSQLNGVSSCGNSLLLQKQLREEWQSDAIVQTDCCDSVQTMVGAISPRTGQQIVRSLSPTTTSLSPTTTSLYARV